VQPSVSCQQWAPPLPSPTTLHTHISCRLPHTLPPPTPTPTPTPHADSPVGNSYEEVLESLQVECQVLRAACLQGIAGPQVRVCVEKR